MEPIKLYLDEVFNGGANGQTLTGDKMLFNLKQMGDGWFDAYSTMLSEHNVATIFAPAGRFLTISTGSLEDNACSMHIFDFMENEVVAQHFANESFGNEDIFMAAWRLIEYKKDYDKFILVAGEIPAQPDPNN